MLVAALTVLACAGPLDAQERRYQGRTVRQWADQLRDSREEEREAAAEALGRFGARAVPVLTPMLRDSDVEVRVATIHALHVIGPAAKEALPDLLWLAEKDSSERIQMGASWVAVPWIVGPGPRVPPLESVPIFVRGMQDPDPARRHGAARGLITVTQNTEGRLDPGISGQVVAGLISALRMPDVQLRRDAVRMLGMIGPPARAAIPELRRLARDEADFHHQAVTALRSIEDR